MAKYRKKPVVIEAVQWLGWDKGPHDLGVEEIQCKFCPIADEDGNCTNDYVSCGPRYVFNELNSFGWINTLEGGHVVTKGDYIITGVQGERYPCKPDIFEQTYEPVD